MLSDVQRDLDLECHREHPPRPFPADLVDVERQFLDRGPSSEYLQHWRSFPASAQTPAIVELVLQRGRYAAPTLRWVIHRFWLYLLQITDDWIDPVVRWFDLCLDGGVLG